VDSGDRYHHHHHRHHVDCETSQSGSCAIRLPRAFHHHGLPVLSMHSANLPVQCPSAHQRNSQLLDPFRWFSVFRLADVPDSIPYLLLHLPAHQQLGAPLQLHVEWFRHVCFFLDYGALSVYSFGCALVYSHYVFPTDYMGTWLHRAFIPLAFINGGCCTMLACSSRLMHEGRLRKLFRMLAFMLRTFVAAFPPVSARLLPGIGMRGGVVPVPQTAVLLGFPDGLPLRLALSGTVSPGPVRHRGSLASDLPRVRHDGYLQPVSGGFR
ncbi:Membrane progestin receptor gamma-B, partial [Apostichopus japonicus]